MSHTRDARRLAIVAGALLPTLTTVTLAQDGRPAALEEVTVTASRREESQSKVPISITAFTQKALDENNVRTVDDIMKLTPGVQFNRTNDVGAIADISIRGISSNAGSGTTGIYIDDTPIQLRADLGGLGSAVWPQIFDLERVEILRGPQGTLFGAGSEGGTVRFITPAPSTTKYDAYVRTEGAFTSGGSPTAEIGAAFNAPLVMDKLGLRLSGSVRHDGGYVDRVDHNAGVVLAEDSNSTDSKTLRVALAWQPTDSVTVTPSFYWQEQIYNDASRFWLNISNPDDHDFRRNGFIADKTVDRFSLPSLKLEWELPGATLVSNTSYFDRHQFGIQDLIAFESAIWAGVLYPPSGMFAPSYNTTDQRIFTQEVRLQSSDPDARLSWVAGVFYQRNKQHVVQLVQNTFLPQLWELGGNEGTFEDAFGMGLQDGLYTVTVWPWDTVDEQLAAFGQADFKFTDQLKATVGLRVAKVDVESDITYGGPINGGQFRETADGSATPVTPKFGLSYQVNDGTMLYSTVAKGYRIGGGNNPVSVNCGETDGPTPIPDSDLGDLGLTHRPPTYEDDSLWSYEVGSKMRTADGRYAVDASVYLIKWEDIQFQANLPRCGFSFTTNAGSATSKGFELALQARPIEPLTLGLGIGYVHATYDKTVYLGGTQLEGASNITGKDKRILASPWTVAFNGQWGFTVLEHDSYFRLNYTYAAKLDKDLPSQDRDSSNYDPNLRGLPEVTDLTLKLGTRFGGLDVAAFVNNVTDEQPYLGYGHYLRSSPLYTTATSRPRTVGVTASYRFQ